MASIPEGNLLSALLRFLFDSYDKEGLRYCILRHYEQLPDSLASSDLDILIDRRDRKRNEAVIKAAVARFGCTVYHVYEDERLLQYFLYKKLDDRRLFFLKCDFFCQSELYGCCYISGEHFLARRKRYRRFYVAEELDGLLDKLVYLYLLNAPIPAHYLERAKVLLAERGEEFGQRLASLLGAEHGTRLRNAVRRGGEWNSPEVTRGQRLHILWQWICGAPLAHLRGLPRFLYYRLRYRLFPQGELISLSGPDGCGKTTLLSMVAAHLAGAFRFGPENIFHHRPHLFPRIAEIAHKLHFTKTVDANYASPHRGKPSGFIGSLLRLGYYVLDYSLGYLVKVRPLLVRRQPVVFDRYFYDVVADCERTNIALPQGLLRRAFTLVPVPSSAFYIEVSPSTILSRKQELTPEAIDRLCLRYRELVQTRPEFVAIQNEAEAETAAALLVDTIIRRRARTVRF